MPLEELSAFEWEALCDGCGKCCLVKLTDEDTGELYYTNVACRLLDKESCRCRDYTHRITRVPDCVQISYDPQIFSWLPDTCAYKLRWRGMPLPSWHPLIKGDDHTMHAQGFSVRGKTISEELVDDIREHVIDWVE